MSGAGLVTPAALGNRKEVRGVLREGSRPEMTEAASCARSTGYHMVWTWGFNRPKELHTFLILGNVLEV